MTDAGRRADIRAWSSTGTRQALDRVANGALRSGDVEALRQVLTQEYLDQTVAQEILTTHPQLSYLGVQWETESEATRRHQGLFRRYEGEPRTPVSFCYASIDWHKPSIDAFSRFPTSQEAISLLVAHISGRRLEEGARYWARMIQNPIEQRKFWLEQRVAVNSDRNLVISPRSATTDGAGCMLPYGLSPTIAGKVLTPGRHVDRIYIEREDPGLFNALYSFGAEVAQGYFGWQHGWVSPRQYPRQLGLVWSAPDVGGQPALRADHARYIGTPDRAGSIAVRPRFGQP